MLEALGLLESAKMIAYLMISLAFFVGIMLVVSYEAFEHFNSALQKEYGWRKRVWPHVETPVNSMVDGIVSRYPALAGVLISASAFILLMIYK